ncbi:unnamed protein product, partial [Laminaria digitata]
LLQPRPETVLLSATEKREMRTWGLDVNATTWQDGTCPPPWVTMVGDTTNKWANSEMAMIAAKDEQEYLENIMALPASSQPSPADHHLHHHRHPHHRHPHPHHHHHHHHHRQQRQQQPAPQQPSDPLPPWVKKLPPVRDGRAQLATGEIIPFLDQHAYPAGGVVEVKRARRREKQAFLSTV